MFFQLSITISLDQWWSGMGMDVWVRGGGGSHPRQGRDGLCREDDGCGETYEEDVLLVVGKKVKKWKVKW